MELNPEFAETRRRRALLILPIAWGALALLLVVLLCSAWQGPDIFYHMALGRGIIASGHPQPPDPVMAQQPGYLNVYWLFQVVTHGLFSAGGVMAVSLFMMAVWIGVFYLWWRIAKASLLPAVGLPIALAALLIIHGRFDPRPDAVSWLFLMLELFWLTTWDFTRKLSWKKYVLFALVQVLWTNMHVFFVLGPIVAAMALLSRFLHGESEVNLVESAKLFVVTLVASFVSPFGFKSWGLVATLWRAGKAMSKSIMELHPPTGTFLQLWTVKLLWIFWGVTALVLLYLLVRRRLRIFDGLLVLPALYLSATSVRYIPALPLFSAPLWGLFFESLARKRRDLVEGVAPRGGAGRLTLGIAAGMGLLSLALGIWAVTGGFYHSLQSPTKFGPSLPPNAYPTRVAEYLRTVSFEGKVFNNSADGGYLEYIIPRIRPYADSRYMDVSLTKEYFTALGDPQAFQKLDKEWVFDGVLLRVAENPELLGALLAGQEWMLVYSDLHRAFFVRLSDFAAHKWAAGPLRFYQGEDLAALTNGTAAIQWVVALVHLTDRPLLMEALKQIDRSPRIPSWVIQYALGFGLQQADKEMVALGRGMYPRMFLRTIADRSAVDRLMAATADM